MNREAGFPSAADLAQLRMCDCGGHHQVDEKGIGINGRHCTTCPNHPTFNADFAASWEPSIRRWKTGAEAGAFGPISGG